MTTLEILNGKYYKMQPTFWKHKSLLAILMLPASMLYSLAGAIRNIITSKYYAKVPIICVGNVTVGGAGKTPIVLALSQLLKKQNLNVAIVSRGYKGEIKTPTRVDKKRHTVHSVGDEPLMLARIAPTYIARMRSLAIQMAEDKGANIVIMDDGLQNPTIAKNLSLLVIDGKYGIGNGFIMPAGPLRESLASGISNADAVILVGNDDTEIANHPAFYTEPVIPVIRARLKPHGKLPDKTVSYIAFAGIGNPDKFFSTLIENGYNIVKTIPFPDHYNYTDTDINTLIHTAKSMNVKLITTEKDAVRLPPFVRKKFRVLPVRIVWDDETQIQTLLEKII